MAYSQVQVMIGGAVHIPILIGFLKVCDNKTSRSYNNQKAAAEAKAKAVAEAQAKAAAEAKAKAAAEAKAKARAKEDSTEQ